MILTEKSVEYSPFLFGGCVSKFIIFIVAFLPIYVPNVVIRLIKINYVTRKKNGR